MLLGEQVWREVQGSQPLLIPLGATEQHGPHLPLDTDTRIAVAVAHRAAPQAGAVVAPALAYGSSGEHAGFAGTVSIGNEALRSVIVELVRSASSSFDRVVFVNGHGGNHSTLASAVGQMQVEGHSVSAWSPRVPGGDAHAGRTETSLMLAIDPDLVRLDQAEAGNIAPIAELLPALRSGGVQAASPNGVLGDPTGATAEEGRRLLAQLSADLIRHLGARSCNGV